MQRAELPFSEIFNNLLAGKKLVLHFPDAKAAETFRVRLHHHKAAQAKTFVKLGLAFEDETTSLQFKVKPGEKAEDGVVAFVAFVAPSPLKKYAVAIIEEQDLNNGAEVSASLG